MPAAGQAARQREAGENFDKAKLDNVAELIQRYQKMAELAYILAVPPSLGQGDQWHSIGETSSQSIGTRVKFIRS